MPSVRLLRFSKLDLVAWDECVAGARQVVPYAHSWWLAATAGRWDALVEAEEDTGRYLALWPLPTKWRPSGRQAYQPLFTQQLGLISRPESTAELLRPPLLLRRYARFYAQLNDANCPLPAPLSPKINVQERQTYHLDLSSAYEPLRASYCADYCRRLRLHAATPLVVADLPDAEPLLTLFRQTKGPAAGLRPRHYARLRHLIAELRARHLLEARAAYAPATGELLAGALFVRYRTRLIYLFAAASNEGKKAAAPLLLLDDAIRRHAGTAGLVLDFEGGMLPAIARFFANFGAAPVPYATLSFTKRPWYLPAWMR